MPKGGSVNHIESSDFTTTSFGEFSGLPSNLSVMAVMRAVVLGARDAAGVVLAAESRPWRSRVLPFAKFEGLRKTLTRPVCSSHFMMRLFGMSLQRR